MILCPKCKTPLGEVGPTGRFEAVCSRCRFKFESIKGRLVERSSVQPVAYRTSAVLPLSHGREYELAIELGDRTVEVLSFGIPQSEDRIKVYRGDTVSAIHSMRETHREELLEIVNHSTGARYRIGDAGAKAARDAGVSAGIIAAFAAAFLVALGAPASALLALPPIVLGGSWFLLKKRFLPTHTLAPEAHAALTVRQSLLATRADLIGLRTFARQEAEERLAVRTRLDTLRLKMLKVGIDAYNHRIATIERGLSIIDRQLEVDRLLLDGYDKSILMMEIEYESADAADVIPSGVNALIQEKVAELDALRAQQRELTTDLTANAEVEAFLRSGPKA